MKNHRSFHFYTERRLVELTGLKARNLQELLSVLRGVPGSSIFYHTHHLFLSHHFEKPVVYNEFATWVGDALQERELSEKLAAIDLLAFTSIRQIREAIVSLIEASLAAGESWLRQCPAGEAFHFCKSRSFIMPTSVVAEGVPDFFAKLPRVTNISLYFHFLEARLRLGRPTNDFSTWLADLGERELAGAIDRLDPYARTLDELREDMIAAWAARGRS
jgi:hypothetical protein